MFFHSKVDSGSPGLDTMLDSIRLGDNVVWQIDDVEDYADFARRFAAGAIDAGRRLVYFRFARHGPILPPDLPRVVQYDLDPAEGFERFAGKIHEIATVEGLKVFYVFDCLSDLVEAWATDLMIGNFFVATCPYLFELQTVAYFGVLRNRHASETIARIRETTQLFIELYRAGAETYIQALKVWNRYSPTMFLPHRFGQAECSPLTEAGEAAAFFASIGSGGFRGSGGKLDSWDRLFMKAEELCLPGADPVEREAMKRELCGRILCRDERVVALARERFSLDDLVAIKSRMIGSGCIGGKATGMLLARKILSPFAGAMEGHDSFYVGSDVFYSYLVQNSLWEPKMRQRTAEGYFALAEPLRQGLSKGVFPEAIKEQFYQTLEYFGQAPIIVRSSSLLEDGYGNAFAGKYESVFRVNQGSPEERYARFEEAVRAVYASMMDDSALAYRKRMGLDAADEQMALLVQRVSGSFRGSFFFPLVSGVADSRNAYAWKPGLDPRAGMLRLVIGLGTRAVDRTGDDYPRLVALDEPEAHPYAGIDDLVRHSQRGVDVLNLESNQGATIPLESALPLLDPDSLERVSRRDYGAEERLRELGRGEREIRYADFAGFLVGRGAAETLRSMLAALEEAYRYPIDAEFTLNPERSAEGSGFKINILQCRPLAAGKGAAHGKAAAPSIPAALGPGRAILDFRGNSMGGGTLRQVSRIVYIPPSAYIALPPTLKRGLADQVGIINSGLPDPVESCAILMSPGRCGSSSPDLGLPVAFSAISNFSCLAEISDPAAGFMPELSYGSHFFRDLVEADIYFMAVFAEREGVLFDRELMLSRFDPDSEPMKSVAPEFKPAIRIMDYAPGELLLASDIATGRTCLYFP